MAGQSASGDLPGSRNLDTPSAPLAGLQVRRSVGFNGTRFSAGLDDDVIGCIEVEIWVVPIQRRVAVN